MIAKLLSRLGPGRRGPALFLAIGAVAILAIIAASNSEPRLPPGIQLWIYPLEESEAAAGRTALIQNALQNTLGRVPGFQAVNLGAPARVLPPSGPDPRTDFGAEVLARQGVELVVGHTVIPGAQGYLTIELYQPPEPRMLWLASHPTPNDQGLEIAAQRLAHHLAEHLSRVGERFVVVQAPVSFVSGQEAPPALAGDLPARPVPAPQDPVPAPQEAQPNAATATAPDHRPTPPLTAADIYQAEGWGFEIEVEANLVEEHARETADILQAQGFSPHVAARTDALGRTWYFVRLNHFRDRPSAVAGLNAFLDRSGLPAVLVPAGPRPRAETVAAAPTQPAAAGSPAMAAAGAPGTRMPTASMEPQAATSGDQAQAEATTADPAPQARSEALSAQGEEAPPAQPTPETISTPPGFREPIPVASGAAPSTASLPTGAASTDTRAPMPPNVGLTLSSPLAASNPATAPEATPERTGPVEPAATENPAPSPPTATPTAPVAATPPQPPPGARDLPFFEILVESNLMSANSEQTMARLRDKGYQPYLRRYTDQRGRRWHSVRIGLFRGHSAGVAALEEFRRRTGRADGVVTPVPRLR